MTLDDDFAAALAAFRATARRLMGGGAPLRPALPAPPALKRAALRALSIDPADADAARIFFERDFEPRLIDGASFVTAYYEPEVAGSWAPSAEFTEAVLARPPDLVSFAADARPEDFDPTLAAARLRPDGALEPYPERAEIERQGRAPLLWLTDAVEVFMIQVQGSARVNLPNGRQVRLIYDGRNGQPYTSIGRLLIEAGEIPEREMSLQRLKSWLRQAGLKPGEPGRELMRRNRSYIFFRVEENVDPVQGPIGGAGVPMTALRSLAVDRARWPYGLPYWIEADLPWRDGVTSEPFRRLMVGQDTGTAIVGAGRFDLFFGSGEAAGGRAGAIRHRAQASVLWPRETSR